MPLTSALCFKKGPMNKRTEISTLKEFAKIAENPNHRTVVYQRVSLILVFLGAVATGASYFLSLKGIFSPGFAVGGGLVGGIMVGLGIYYSIAKQQVPLFADYFHPDVEAMRRRIKELESG